MTKKYRMFRIIDTLLFLITLICLIIITKNVFLSHKATVMDLILIVSTLFLYSFFSAIMFLKMKYSKGSSNSIESISEDKKSEFELIYAGQKERNKDKYVMCRSISQSMRTINSDINSLIEIDEDNTPNKAKEYEESIKSEAESMYGFLNQLILCIEDDSNALEQIKSIIENPSSK